MNEIEEYKNPILGKEELSGHALCSALAARASNVSDVCIDLFVTAPKVQESVI